MVIGNECINVNIFGIVYAKYADNMLGVHTSLGRSVVAYNLDPQENLAMGEQVGIIQTGDTFICFRTAKKPLRSVLALDNPIEYGKLNPAQYFAAVVAHEIGNVTRLYEAGVVKSLVGNFLDVGLKGATKRLKTANWVLGTAIGDNVLIDNELGMVVGFAGVKRFGFFALANYKATVPICDEFRNIIRIPLTVNVTRNSRFSEGGISGDVQVFGGSFSYDGFLPDVITLKYDYNGKSYRSRIVLDDLETYCKWSGKGFIDIHFNSSQSPIINSRVRFPDLTKQNNTARQVSASASGHGLVPPQEMVYGISFDSAIGDFTFDFADKIAVSGSWQGFYQGGEIQSEEADLWISTSSRNAAGDDNWIEYKDGRAILGASSPSRSIEWKLGGIEASGHVQLKVKPYKAELI